MLCLLAYIAELCVKRNLNDGYLYMRPITMCGTYVVVHILCVAHSACEMVSGKIKEMCGEIMAWHQNYICIRRAVITIIFHDLL